jgi:hypothetical protein
MTLLDQAAFENGGCVAATTNSRVSAGTLLPADASGTVREVVRSDAGSVQMISRLFPPAKQTSLHPFGMLDYSLSFLAYTMLSNDLGYVQKRFVGAEEVASFGSKASYE